MDFCIYDSRLPIFKEPFGAVAAGTSVCFSICLPKDLLPSKVEFVLCSDGENDRFFPMELYESNLRFNRYTLTYTPQHPKLHFYYFQVTEPDGTLHSVTERTRIETYENGVHFTEDGGASWTDLPGDTPVSMNLWGFGKSFLDEAENRFAAWLDANLPTNPLKCEYFLPLVVTELIEEGKAKIQVLRSTDKWYGVTYREDKPLVVEAIARKTAEGQYPENLWA